jgi:endonuclease/exonuclease/phosphatase family metal-dependent hydrolase
VILGRALLAATVAVFLPATLPAAPHAAASPGNVVFMSWNVRNYILQPARDANGRPEAPPKAEESIAALVVTMTKTSPDILGLCEIGTRRDLADLQGRLKNAGLDLPHSLWVDGGDQSRHLALLSRYPLESVKSAEAHGFVLGGLPREVRRGFLDCVVKVRPGFDLRVLGAHFKSRRVVPEFDQAEFRRQESLVLRRHMESILQADPSTRLLLFGDFNDTKNSPAVSGLLGRPGAASAMSLLPLTDSLGDSWTYRWEESDEYSRVDFVMVSTKLRPLVDRRRSRLPRTPNWHKASDHRPLVVTLKLPPSSTP